MSANILQFVREEDYVEYFLFADEPLDVAEIHGIAEKFSKGYIWHKDTFKVHPRDSETRVLQEVLTESKSKLDFAHHGVTHFGDNIQDEWHVVAILLELTRKIPGLVARVVDSDGEFLLIEAAHHLPQWVSPETAEGKVFLYNGQVHLVSDNGNSFDDPVTQLRANPNKFCIGNAAFESINDRIKIFPSKIHETLHRATVFVPVGVAWVLRKNAQLIAKAVLAFCNRDPIDSRVIKAMRYFPPEDRVYTSVTFTKCLYAMLTHNHFIPDRRTGWNLPATKTPEHKAHLLGVKLACGFEILACQGRSTDPATDRHWIQYKESLKKRGYFQEFIEGSRDYTTLQEKAKTFYDENCSSAKANAGTSQEIASLLKEMDTDELHRAQKSLPKEDPDDWLNISSEDLDQMLEKRYGQSSLITTVSTGIPAVMNEFLEKKSDFEGVETEPLPTIQPTSRAAPTNGIDFDPNEFQNAMQNLLEMVIPEDKWDSNSDMSDYENDDDLERNLEQMTSKADFEQYLDQMDRELAKTTIGKSFEKTKKKNANDNFDDIEDFTPVDIDANAVQNMMESYKSQLGGPGPASNLLGAMGFKVQDDEKPLKSSQV